MNIEAKDLSRIRGELVNFAKAAIEYYQRTSLAYPPSLSITAKRLAEASFKAGEQQGMRKVMEWIEEHELGICGYTGSKGSITESKEWQAFKKENGL